MINYRQRLIFLCAVMLVSFVVRGQSKDSIVIRVLNKEINLDSLSTHLTDNERVELIGAFIQAMEEDSMAYFTCKWNVILNDSIKTYFECQGVSFDLYRNQPLNKVVYFYLIDRMFWKSMGKVNYMELYEVGSEYGAVSEWLFYTCGEGIKKKEYRYCEKPIGELNCQLNQENVNKLREIYLNWYKELLEKGYSTMHKENKGPLYNTNLHWRDAFVEEKIKEKNEQFFRQFKRYQQHER